MLFTQFVYLFFLFISFPNTVPENIELGYQIPGIQDPYLMVNQDTAQLEKNNTIRIMTHPSDSIIIKSKGQGNTVQLDNRIFKGEVDEKLKNSWSKGEIKQQGNDNTVNIQSQKESGSTSPNSIKVVQTGNNNRATIISNSKPTETKKKENDIQQE